MRALLASCGLALVACGTDPLPCNFTEAADATNDMTSEATSVNVGSGTEQLCGHVDNGHYDTTSKSVDIDTFRVTAPADGSYIIQLLGDPDLAMLLNFSVVVRDTTAHPAILAAGTFDGSAADHLAFLAELPAGDMDVTVSASADADIAAPLAYKLRFVADTPDRCATITAAANYTESSDGANNTGNDMLVADFTADPQYAATPDTSDAPEATNLTVGGGSKLRVSGSCAKVDSPDPYQDHDTYAIKAASDELTIRLDWMGSADLDYAVFEENGTTPVGLGNTGDSGGGEFQTFAVKPGTVYWVWVAELDGGAAPTAYDLSICGGQLAP